MNHKEHEMPENIDHTAIYKHIDDVEQRMANVMKWAVGIILTVMIPWVLYSANASSRQTDRDIASVIQISELSTLVKAMQAQILSLQSYVQDQNRVIAEGLEEHEHNPEAHHTVSGTRTFRYKTPYVEQEVKE